ncbi:MAG: UvrD-helicase domain-containing protein [Planctomycetes bacterium]|nr:UvrD-helicase domain-containing protein [Planctomycetota bacterium]
MIARYPNIVIRASAGTGKTFQLSNRFLELLDNDVPLDQVLAATFTRKAAGEILDRILVRLADAALDAESCTQLGEHLRDPELTRTRCRRILAGAARNLHRLRVSTLDAFFAKIASSFALELGLPPGWRIVDELQDAQMRAEAIQAVISQDSASDVLTLMHLLTKGEAKRGVGDLLRDTVNEVYHVFCETVPEAWTSVPRYRHVTDERLSQAIETLRTMEFADKRLRQGCDRNLASVEANDWEGFINAGPAAKIAAGETTYYSKPIPDCAIKEYMALLHHARATLVGHVANQTEAAYKVLKKFHVEYQRLKQERRALRFEDITRRLADAAMLGDEERVSFRLDGAVSHLLLDEFQDTALSQWTVLRPFAQRAAAGGPGGSFFCVGDVKQAIYGWRGGVAELFDALGAELERLGTNSLNRSFRSSPAVIETVNRVFTRITEHPNLEHYEPAVRAWSEQFEPHTTAKEKLPGYVTLEVSPAAEEDDREEDVHYAWCARRVAELVQQAPGLSVGVLVRRNACVGRMIFLLRELGLHASEEGGNPVTDSAAVETVLALLRLADHPGDKIARFHVAHSPSLGEFNLDDWRDEKEVAALSQTVRRRLMERGYGPTVYDVARALAPACSERDQSRLQQLVELAYQWQTQSSLRTRDFIDFAEHQKVSDPTSADVRVMTVHQAKGLEFDMVVLPELDAPLVGQPGWFVVGRDEPTGPVNRVCRYTNKNIQDLMPPDFQEMFQAAATQTARESLCVLYVALTRAAHALHMMVRPSAAGSRKPCKTYAGLLRSALTDGAPLSPDSTAYACGDPNWHEQALALKAAEAAKAPAPPELPPAPTHVALKRTDQRRRRLERSAPSQLEGGRCIKLTDVLGREDMTAIQRGLVMHAWFEAIEWLDPRSPESGIPDDAALRRIGRQTAKTPIDLDPLISEFRQMLQQPETAAALSREQYLKSRENLALPREVLQRMQGGKLRLAVDREQRIAVREGEMILMGHIDRVVQIYDADQLIAADLIDFKTDVLRNKKALDDRIKFYQPQLDAYRRALAKMLRLPPAHIAARMLFVTRGAIAAV